MRFATRRPILACPCAHCEPGRRRSKISTLAMSRPMRRRWKKRGRRMGESNLQAARPAPVAPPSRYGEVFDRGYARYDGPRLGRRGAYGALVLYSIKRALGIKKSWTAKIIPILLYSAAFVPV